VTPDQFIKKWMAAHLSERSAAQQHFLDLCQLLGEPTPAEADPTGETFTFEKGGTTATGGHGWADVWKKGAFAWEYKGPGKDLNAAYMQLKKYADMLENPPLLITSDTKRIEIHTNFTNTVKTVHVLELTDLADTAKREILRAAFTQPEKLRPGVTRQQVTKDAAERFSQLAHHLQGKGYEPQRVAHFLNRLIFCMFAEDVGLLPNRIFTKLATASVAHPEAFEAHAKQLFAGMAKGGTVAFEVIDWFDGGLFDDDATLPLDAADLKLVLLCAELDWSNIEPSIFGTLFERGLDPDKRSQQGTHYTDPETIMKIVRPVVLEPWGREWEAEKTILEKQTDRATKNVSEAAKQRYYAFLERLANFKVLDPACGSGNFLYLALRGLKDFEKRVIHEAETLGLPSQFPRVGPEAVLGIEVNPYAAELSRVTIWIGELQWMIENGFGAAKNPILKPLDQIECRDAILNADGTEPGWPRADVIVGNPPFLGDKRMIGELGKAYVATLRAAYAGAVTASADLVCYWFEKARQEVAEGRVTVAGLVATRALKQQKNREVLDRIAATCELFDVWPDEPWINEGAAVRVCIVCWTAKEVAFPKSISGSAVDAIRADLTPAAGEGSGPDLTTVKQLQTNLGKSFFGLCLAGAFVVDGPTARQWLVAVGNPNGAANSDVLRPLLNGFDVTTKRFQDRWVIDFGTSMPEVIASRYEAPFQYVVEHVKPLRLSNNRKARATRWWIHGESRPGLRQALKGLSHYIATPERAKHRYFLRIPVRVAPEHRLVVFPRDDFASFGILSSTIHVRWALELGSRLEDRPGYNTKVCYNTFPFPTGLGPEIKPSEYDRDPRAQNIVAAAKQLTDLREKWLNPPELLDRIPEVVPGYPDRLQPKNETAASELKKRTLTKLYNVNPAWLQHAHRELDEAVAAAYGWEWPLLDDEIIKRLFKLNQERAAQA